MEASTEWKMRDIHSSPTALGLGISAPPPPQKKKKKKKQQQQQQQKKVSEFFVWDWEGTQKCFILRDQTTGDLKSHHLQARVTLTALSMPPQPHFLSAELLCHISNLSGTVKKIKVTGILISLCSSTGSLYETTNNERTNALLSSQHDKWQWYCTYGCN